MPSSYNYPLLLNASAVKSYKVIFWDFDGVIKDSLAAKSDAFGSLFLDFGMDFASMVKEHHEKNGGVSRYEKIPTYLKWANEVVTPEVIESYCEKFSTIVFKSVLTSPWVPGIYNYIEKNFKDQIFILVTATPLQEILDIIHHLEIAHCFQRVFGSPTRKFDAINRTLIDLNISCDEALMIGDSQSDLTASRNASVKFLLRRNAFNTFLHSSCHPNVFDDLINE